MNKGEAIEAMEKGNKVRHAHFDADEWMTIDKNADKFLFEDGCLCDFSEFWLWRADDSWQKNWSLFKE